jgi:hypothetical protein
VDGVTKQNFEIVGFAMAEELIHWLKQEIEKS